MKELTEALNSQSFHFYLHASFIPRRRAASQQMTSIFSVLVTLAVVLSRYALPVKRMQPTEFKSW